MVDLFFKFFKFYRYTIIVQDRYIITLLLLLLLLTVFWATSFLKTLLSVTINIWLSNMSLELRFFHWLDLRKGCVDLRQHLPSNILHSVLLLGCT